MHTYIYIYLSIRYTHNMWLRDTHKHNRRGYFHRLYLLSLSISNRKILTLSWKCTFFGKCFNVISRICRLDLFVFAVTQCNPYKRDTKTLYKFTSNAIKYNAFHKICFTRGLHVSFSQTYAVGICWCVRCGFWFDNVNAYVCICRLLTVEVDGVCVCGDK